MGTICDFSNGDRHLWAHNREFDPIVWREGDALGGQICFGPIDEVLVGGLRCPTRVQRDWGRVVIGPDDLSVADANAVYNYLHHVRHLDLDVWPSFNTRHIMAVDPIRLAVGRMAQHLASGYYAFLVAHLVAVNPQSINSLPHAKVLGEEPTGEIKRKDGTVHTLNLRFYLDLLREDERVQGDFLRTWATGALLMLGDELKKHRYFDHAPILELIYHLRNGIAHGNQFNIDARGKDRLAKHKAHNHNAAVKSPLGTMYEITPDVTGPILFDFIGAADVIDLLQSVEVYLSQ